LTSSGGFLEHGGESVLLGGKSFTVRVWEAQTGEERLRLTLDGEVRQAIWNQDESLILTRSGGFGSFVEPGTVQVWEAQTGTAFS
jgi:WD40 repeat protein